MTQRQRLENYKNQLQSLEERERHLSKYSTTLSAARLVTFIIVLALAIYTASISGLLAVALSIAGMGIFLWLVKYHHKKDKEKDVVIGQKSIINNEISSILQLDNAYYDGSKYVDPDHHFTSDLDVFGPFSLYGLINRSKTYAGLNTLAEYLSAVPALGDLIKRKELILELEKIPEWRLDYLSSLSEISDGQTVDTKEEVAKILEIDFTFATNTFLSVYRKMLPAIWLALIISYYYVPQIITPLAVLLALINFYITMRHAQRVSGIQNRLSSVAGHFDKYASALGLIYQREWKADIIRDWDINETDLQQQGKIAALETFKRLSDLLDYRLHMIPAFVLNTGLLWDTQICARIDQWYHTHRLDILGVFGLIGKMEAVVSLATWSYNHPHYVYAEIDDDYFHLDGQELRHPLLQYDECVPNSFGIQKEDHVGIITGSNMSGKSTFLRTIGLNILLGNAGARVSATSMTYSLVHIITYMRIKDALEESVSTFKSELNRVVKILDELDQKAPVLIIADEMLRGTNSLDKLKGSKAIVRRILDSQSFGLIATHDIGLAQMSTSLKGISNFYFDIDYADGELLFDYEIRPGICQNFNASHLLAQLGLKI